MTIAQQIVDALIVIMAALLAFFVLSLLAMHVLTNARNAALVRMRQALMELVSVNSRAARLRAQLQDYINPDGEIESLEDIHGIRSRIGLQVLDETARLVRGPEYGILQTAIAQPFYLSFLQKRIDRRNLSYALLAVQVAEVYRIYELTGHIEAHLVKNSKNIDAQNIDLFALSSLNAADAICRVCTNRDFVLKLSFRALQEVFSAFGGDKLLLFRRLIYLAPDPYIRRACIRQAGKDRLVALAPDIYRFIETDNFNMRIDVVRTLGELGYAEAACRIERFLTDPRWEVRSAAVQALSALDIDAYAGEIEARLCDKEWWVRYHSASALMQLPDHDALLARIAAKNDRFALEMMRFALQKDALMKGGAPC